MDKKNIVVPKTVVHFWGLNAAVFMAALLEHCDDAKDCTFSISHTEIERLWGVSKHLQIQLLTEWKKERFVKFLGYTEHKHTQVD